MLGIIRGVSVNDKVALAVKRVSGSRLVNAKMMDLRYFILKFSLKILKI